MTKSAMNVVAAWPMALLLELAALVKRLVSLPSPDDPAAVRDWVRQLVELAAKFDNWLPEAARRAIEVVREIADSDAVWAAFYKLFLALFRSEQPVAATTGEVSTSCSDPAIRLLLDECASVMAAESGKGSMTVAGFDPTLIFQIVSAVVALLRELRKE